MQALDFKPGNWDLKDAVPGADDEGAGALAAGLKAKAAKFEKLRQKLESFTREDMEAAMKAYEELAEHGSRITAFAYMRYSTDTADQKVKAALDRAEDLKAEVDNSLVFFRLWWTGLSERDASRLAPADPDHVYFLSQWRKLKPHTLDEKVEQAVNLKNVTGFSGWTHHYDKVTSTFTFTLKAGGRGGKGKGGKPRKLVVDEVVRLFSSSDPKAREAAYRALLDTYASNGDVLGEVYRTIARDWNNEQLKLRSYGSAIAPRNLENDVGDKAVGTLLDSCRKNRGVFQDFFKTKGELLGMKKMSRYHIYAPLSKKERTIEYSDAVSMVLAAFKDFSPKAGELALNVFARSHVDSSPRKGKTHGAYCMSVTPGVVPYLFLNYAGAQRDVYTIAHESGHAIHSQLSSAHSVLTFHPPLVLAETASVFGEMILFDKFMRQERDPEVKKGVLLDKISSMYATIGRQAYFVVFENAAHPAVIEGATVSDLCDTYLKLLREQFGSGMVVPEEFKWEWTYIPHIYHTPFYCYAYAFGNLLSLALYDAYTKEGESFVPKYLRLLSYGGSRSPEEILDEVGVDINSAAFWQGGFDVVRRMVSELQEL